MDRFVRFLEIVFRSPVVRALLIGCAVFAVATGLVYGGDSVAVSVGIGTALLALCWALFVLWLAFGDVSKGSGVLFAEGDVGTLLPFAIFAPHVTVLFLCSFVFMPSDTAVWVIEGRTTLSHRWIVAVPFYHDIQKISLEQSKMFYPTIITDDKRIEGRVLAQVSIERDEQLLISWAQQYANVNRAVVQELEEDVSNRFRSVVASRSVLDSAIAFSLQKTKGPDYHTPFFYRGVTYGEGMPKMVSLRIAFTD